ncbi:MAG: hypothetical protein FWF83_08775, partial [Clostridiales bacterium]|nr:hypothetical protein [Clostridiales bacterium]
MIITGTIEGCNHEGMGVLRHGDRVVFVPGALSGETVRVRLSDRKKGRVTWGDLEEILEPSPHRIAPPCPHAGRCGGCQLNHAVYPHQLECKTSILSRALAPLKTLCSDVEAAMAPIIPALATTCYRNKGVFAIGMTMDAVAIGFYGRQSRAIAGHGCPLLFSPAVNRILDDLAQWLSRHCLPKVAPHHVLIRESDATGDIILVLIGDTKPPWLSAFADAFMQMTADSQEYPSINATTSPTQHPLEGLPSSASTATQPASVDARLSGVGWLSSPAKKGPVVDGEPTTLRGSLSIVETLVIPYCAYFPIPQTAPTSQTAPTPQTQPTAPTAHTTTATTFQYTFSPASFFQVNTRQTQALYSEVLSACALTGSEVVWDLYCGAGTISSVLASRAQAVLGLDTSEAAIRDAWANARANANAASLHERLCFLAGAAEDLAPALLSDSDYLAQTLQRQKKLYTATDGQC